MGPHCVKMPANLFFSIMTFPFTANPSVADSCEHLQKRYLELWNVLHLGYLIAPYHTHTKPSAFKSFLAVEHLYYLYYNYKVKGLNRRKRRKKYEKLVVWLAGRGGGGV